MEFPPFQSRQEVVIHAPLQAVWDFNQDLTNIAVYHPRVERVDLISGKRERGKGVAYRCHLTDGKHTCVEKDLEVVPMERIVTAYLKIPWELPKCFQIMWLKRDLLLLLRTRQKWNFAIITQRSLSRQNSSMSLQKGRLRETLKTRLRL